LQRWRPDVLVPPAIEAILSSENNRIKGFLAAGHVCTVMGYNEYFPIVEKYKVPIVVTGFEPLDIMEGVYMCVKQLEENRAELENQYVRSVKRDGNTGARGMIKRVFKISNRKWRGVGEIASSGLALQDEFKEFDACSKFDVNSFNSSESDICISGEILQGIKKPDQCPAFGKECTPLTPLGATMVSEEGACSAYYRYRSKNYEKTK